MLRLRAQMRELAQVVRIFQGMAFCFLYGEAVGPPGTESIIEYGPQVTIFNKRNGLPGVPPCAAGASVQRKNVLCARQRDCHTRGGQASWT